MDCKNILIIEDETAIRQTMQEILEAEGYNVLAAANGKEGIDLLLKLSPLPCIILLDLMMPVMFGWEFLDFQRNDPKLREVPIVICSAYEESAKSVKPAAFVPKPLQLNRLLGAVSAFCA